MTAHLLVDISAHGLGHLAQTAPVLAELRRQAPGLRISIHSGLARERLARRIPEPFHHHGRSSDFGFVMHNAIDLDPVASAHAYREAHDDWDRRVAELGETYRREGYTVVLANAAYLPLAAAAVAGIPAIGMCSLNWADLFKHYFGDEAWAGRITGQMEAAYNAADCFLRVSPGMPMSFLRRRRQIGPIATLASASRASLRHQLATVLSLDPSSRWVLVAMGGMDLRLPLETWESIPGVQWICPGAWDVSRPDVRPFDGSHDVNFTDLLRASDAVLTKPGYGTFVEAACNGTPVLYVPRDNWPEEAPLTRWLHDNVAACRVDRERLWRGDLRATLDDIWHRSSCPQPPSAEGIQQAVAIILPLLQ